MVPHKRKIVLLFELRGKQQNSPAMGPAKKRRKMLNSVPGSTSGQHCCCKADPQRYVTNKRGIDETGDNIPNGR
jgi:hypothetical protein